MSRKRIPLNQNGCTANFRIGVPFEQNLHVNALRKFTEKINHRGITSCEYVYLPGTRHETYRSDDRTMEMYLDKIMKFMDSGMVSDSCT